MAGDDDDDALSWGDERDATHVESPLAAAQKVQRASRAERRTLADAAAADPDVEPLPTSSVLLVVLGVLGGIYLLYTVGWIITVQHTRTTAAPPLEEIALGVKKVLAIAVAAFWFGATLWLTRRHRPVVRVIWLAIGALVLVPWPFVFGIANVP